MVLLTLAGTMLAACFRPGGAVMKSAMKKRKRFSGGEGGEAVEKDGALASVFVHTPATDKKVSISEGKSCEKTFGSADPNVDRTSIELPFHCDNCNHYILTIRYNCDKCHDYDLCEKCFQARKAKNKRKCPHKHAAAHFTIADVDELYERTDLNETLPGGEDKGGEAKEDPEMAKAEDPLDPVPTLPSTGATTPGGSDRTWDAASFVTPPAKTKPVDEKEKNSS